MTAAQRQARYRAARADGTPRLRYCRPADRRTMAQRWRDAVGKLLNLQYAYRSWLDSLPPKAAWSDTAGAISICPTSTAWSRRAALGETAKLRYVTLLNVLCDGNLEKMAAADPLLHARCHYYPKVKGLVTQLNSIYNGQRFEDLWLDN